MKQIFLRDFCPEAGEGAENLEPATYHDKQRDCIHPVAKAHHKRMLIRCFRYFSGLQIFDRNRVGRHGHLTYSYRP